MALKKPGIEDWTLRIRTRLVAVTPTIVSGGPSGVDIRAIWYTIRYTARTEVKSKQDGRKKEDWRDRKQR